MKSQIDQEFRESISRLAAERRNYLGDNGDVTHFFKAITDKYPLSDFRACINEHYLVERWDRIVGNNEGTELYHNAPKQLDRRFKKYDRLILSLECNSDWSEIVSFYASLSQPGTTL